jgi:hypothetical protein
MANKWALVHIEDLKQGKTVQFRPKGNSMKGRIESGQLVTVAPAKPEEYQVGDAVMCKVHGVVYVHLIKGINIIGKPDAITYLYLIGNNRGRINGWTERIYGKVIAVEA